MGIHHGAILRILRDDGPQSRAELARRTALSPTALTHLTAQLLKNGTVTELAQNACAGAAVGLAVAEGRPGLQGLGGRWHGQGEGQGEGQAGRQA